MSDSQDQFQKAYTAVNTQKNLPELFCKFVDALRAISSSAQSPELQAEVKTVFQDVNTAVQQYNDQFHLMLRELGVLCQNTPMHRDKIREFFIAYIDLVRLAYTVYKEDEETLQKFHPLLQLLLTLLDIKQIELDQHNPFQNALLLQVTNSAWALSNNSSSMESLANTIKQHRGGHKTRKQKQKRT